MLRVRLLAVLVLYGLLSMFSLAQAPGTGLYAFGSFDNRGFDTINIGNLNVHYEIPIVSKSGRGMPFNYKIVYDGLIWSPAESSGSQTWVPAPNWGLRGVAGNMGGYVTYDMQGLTCPPPKLAFTKTDYTYLDSSGVKHIFNYTWTASCGGGGGASGDGTAYDGSGYWFDGTYVHDAQGRTLAAPVINSIYTANGFLTIGTTTDTNGNTIAGNGSPYINGGSFTDTLGTTALTIGGGGNASSPLTFTYNVARQSDGSTTATATMSYLTYTIATNFACSDSSGNPILNYGPLQNDLVDRITLADGTYYQFNYEDTPGIAGAKTGRLASVTLPAGGTISYQYSGDCGDAINADGTPGRLTRTTSDGTRTYTRTAVNDPRSYPSYHTYTTLVQDEANNQTLYRFSSPDWSIFGGIFYETHRQVYQGDVGGTPLLDQQTCYNGVAMPCDGLGVALPIIETTVATSLNGGASKQTVDDYQGSNLVRESVSDYGGNVLANTTYSYVSPGRISQVLTVNQVGNMIAKQTFGYDEQAPTPTSGLPQHTAVTGPRGNATSSNVWIDPYTTLSSTTIFDDAGVPLSSSGPNGTTTYSYDSTQGFATQITPPTPSSGISIPSYSSYDTASGVQLSASDANFPSSPQIQYSQYDKLLRRLRVDRADGGSTTYTYGRGPWGN